MPQPQPAGEPIEPLYSLMALAVDELIFSMRNHDQLIIKSKQKQCESIHSDILMAWKVQKIAKEKPGICRD